MVNIKLGIRSRNGSPNELNKTDFFGIYIHMIFIVDIRISLTELTKQYVSSLTKDNMSSENRY